MIKPFKRYAFIFKELHINPKLSNFVKKKNCIKEAIVMAWVNVFISFFIFLVVAHEKGRFIIGPEKDRWVYLP